MKAVILAGGLGTRLSEETDVKPKPMVEIGGKPILWHLMKYFSVFGIKDFIICCGYKGYVIKEYFANYQLHNADVTFDLASGLCDVHTDRSEDWNVTLVDTGDVTQTGGRLRRVRSFLDEGAEFFFTYGDGLADVDIDRLLSQHRASGKLATVTAVTPPGRFGRVNLDDSDGVLAFDEKPAGDGGMINGGFFVLSKSVIDLIEGDDTVWEGEPMKMLVSQGQLGAYRHSGFWQPMDTLREKHLLQDLWGSGVAPWKRWK